MTMTTIFTILLILTVLLIGISIYLRRRDLKYEEKPVREALSPLMKAAIEREREMNKVKKEHFEVLLKEASDAHVPKATAEPGPDES